MAWGHDVITFHLPSTVVAMLAAVSVPLLCRVGPVFWQILAKYILGTSISITIPVGKIWPSHLDNLPLVLHYSQWLNSLWYRANPALTSFLIFSCSSLVPTHLVFHGSVPTPVTNASCHPPGTTLCWSVSAVWTWLLAVCYRNSGNLSLRSDSDLLQVPGMAFSKQTCCHWPKENWWSSHTEWEWPHSCFSGKINFFCFFPSVYVCHEL
jgi:hypothetical protein